MKKIKNFLDTWKWFLAFQLSHFGAATCQTLALGAATKINTIIGFVATIKCVIWMADPNSIPSVLKDTFFAVWLQNTILVAIPSFIFLIQALLQLQYEKRATGLPNRIAETLTSKALEKLLMDNRAATDKGYSGQKHSTKLKNIYSNVVTIEAKLINVFSMTIVLVIVLLSGLIINWKIMGLMTFSGLIAALLFFFQQHKTSARKYTQIKEGQILEARASHQIDFDLNRNINPIENFGDTQNRTKEFIKNLLESKNIEKAITIKSNLLMNFGQATLVTLFLVGVLYFGVKDAPLSSIAILAIIFRFTLSYAQAIVRDTSVLASNHQNLIQIRLSSEPSNISNQQQIASNPRDQFRR